MPIIDLQRKMAEKGRIRLGEKEGNRPVKLGAGTAKLTSPDKATIADAAERYGGTTPEPFLDTQWATKVPFPIPVIVPPGDMAFSQWRELWGNGFCKRRCDGQRETISGGPCLCDPDPQRRECKDTTRLSVMLPDLQGLGLWRLESHGYYAAVELAGAIGAIQDLAPSTLVRGTLSTVARTATKFDKNGNPQTYNYVVPTLDLQDVRLSELMAPAGDGISVQIETRPGLTPVPVSELPAGPAPSVRDQIEAVPEPPKRRANAAAPLPATGAPLPGEPDIVEAEIVSGPGAGSTGGHRQQSAAPARDRDPHVYPPGWGDLTGPAKAKATKTARRLAGEHGLAQPASFEDIDPDLAVATMAALS
jgi:hypothetical protein